MTQTKTIYYVDYRENSYGSDFLYWPYNDTFFDTKEAAQKVCDTKNQEEHNKVKSAYKRALVEYQERLDNFNRALRAGIAGVVKPYEPKPRDVAYIYDVNQYELVISGGLDTD